MRFFLALCVFCCSCSFAFAESKEVTKRIYSNYLRGLFLVEEGDYRQGLSELEKAKKLDPESLHIRLKIAGLLIRLGEIDRAEKELKAAKKINPQNFDVSFALMILYSYTQRDKELESEYGDFLKRAHTLKPDDIKISESLAQYYFYKKNYPEAITLYETIVKNNPQYVDGIFLLGFFYEGVGKHQEAITLWKRALTIDPVHAPTLNSLAYIYAEAGTNLDEAQRMVTKAIEKEPDNGSYIDTLGWIHFKKKDYAIALVQLKRALSFTKDPVIYEHLVDVCIAQNQQAEAVSYCVEGLVVFPDNKNLIERFRKYGTKNTVPQKQSH